ncbi:McrC family protein [Promicromonospora panici]|uniref:McrC family protein n=1 Tax=Promicromonospora panici TaxID=2219658 RepID=UPI00101D563F|nr:restriction endonuclease [Promicromonospora panici]
MRLDLTENVPGGTPVVLSDDEATALAAARLVDVLRTGPDTWLLVPIRNRVGAVRVGQLDLVVHPKARFASVLFMLGYARDPGFAAEEVSGLTDDALWPAVAETLARLSERALLRGVLQGYTTRDDSLAVLRGRLRVGDQIALRPGRLLPLEVTYDEYESDISENQILRSALHRMMRVPRLPDSLQARLGHLAARMDAVTLLVPGAPLPAWAPSRLNARYVPVLRLAEMILDHVGLSTSHGGVPVASFVVDMAAVFEEFVGVALGEALRGPSPFGTTRRPYATWMDESARVGIRPDVAHIVDGRVRLVFDAKYKIGTDDGGYPSADLYQIHAYCTVLGLRRGYLVYAGSRAEGAVPVAHRVLNTEIEVVQWPLDVAVAPEALIRQVDEVAVQAAARTGLAR